MNQSGLNPLYAKTLLSTIKSKPDDLKLHNLLLIGIASIVFKGDIRKEKKIESKHTKLAPAWRHSGYLHSILELTTKYQYLTHIEEDDPLNEKKSSMRKKTSAMVETNSEMDPFGHLCDFYNEVAVKKNLNQMTVEEYLTEN